MIDFFNLLKEEWAYHMSNLGIIFLFSLYGAYKTISKRIKLEIFRLFEKKNTKVTSIERNSIKMEQNKAFMKEFIKAFFVLFALYGIYIMFRQGVLS